MGALRARRRGESTSAARARLADAVVALGDRLVEGGVAQEAPDAQGDEQRERDRQEVPPVEPPAPAGLHVRTRGRRARGGPRRGGRRGRCWPAGSGREPAGRRAERGGRPRGAGARRCAIARAERRGRVAQVRRGCRAGWFEGDVGPRATHAPGAVRGIRLVARLAHRRLACRLCLAAARAGRHIVIVAWARQSHQGCRPRGRDRRPERCLVRVSTPRHAAFPLSDSVHRGIVRLSGPVRGARGRWS